MNIIANNCIMKICKIHANSSIDYDTVIIVMAGPQKRDANISHVHLDLESRRRLGERLRRELDLQRTRRQQKLQHPHALVPSIPSIRDTQRGHVRFITTLSPNKLQSQLSNGKEARETKFSPKCKTKTSL